MTDDEWLSPAAMLAWRSFLEVHAQLMPIIEEQFARDGGISHAQYGVLLSLQAEPQGLTMTELASAVFVSKSGLTYQVDRLVDAGLVSRAVDPDDERRRVVRITREGFTVLAAIRPGHIDTLREHFIGGLDRAEVEGLARGLAAVSRGLDARKQRE